MKGAQMQPSLVRPAVIYVDIPKDLDDLMTRVYLLAKKASFPIELRLLGNRVTFSSLDEMIGFAVGVKRTSDHFRGDSMMD